MSLEEIRAKCASVMETAWQGVERVSEALGRPSATLVLGGAVASLVLYRHIKTVYLRPKDAPPLVPSSIPFIGRAQDFGERPIEFLLECREKYGPVFSFMMFGSEITFALGSEATAEFWGTHNDILNAEDLYRNITVPVFGKGVAYDVEHKIFSEQKSMAKEGLTKKRFEAYTSVIEQETNAYTQQWGNAAQLNFFKEMAQMVICTATHCLHGEETRAAFDGTVAALYHDLDGGFSPLAWFFPSWLPFPSFRRRDRAHLELKRRFATILAQRKKNNVMANRNDLMETFMTKPYQRVLNGRNLNDDEVSGMLIALLMAGQHTSSTVSSWVASFVCDTPGLQEKLHAEQVAVFEKMPGPLSMDHLDHMPLLWASVRETLRLRPPIMAIMRRVRKDVTIVAEGRTYVIRKGSQLCVSPTANGRLPEEWDEPEKFDITRFLKENSDGSLTVTSGEQLEKGGKFKWVPFGAGRHRCIGFEFAQVQIRSLLSTIIRKYHLELAHGMPEIDYTTMIHTPKDPIFNVELRQ